MRRTLRLLSLLVLVLIAARQVLFAQAGGTAPPWPVLVPVSAKYSYVEGPSVNASILVGQLMGPFTGDQDFFGRYVGKGFTVGGGIGERTNHIEFGIAQMGLWARIAPSRAGWKLCADYLIGRNNDGPIKRKEGALGGKAGISFMAVALEAGAYRRLEQRDWIANVRIGIGL